MTVFSRNTVLPGHRLFDAPSVPLSQVAKGQVAVIGMPGDVTHSSRIGTRFGPHAPRKATTALWTRWDRGETVCPETGLCSVRKSDWVFDCGDAAIDTRSVERTTEAISSATEAVVRAGGIPLSLGGDHYNSYLACRGASRALADLHPGGGGDDRQSPCHARRIGMGTRSAPLLRYRPCDPFVLAGPASLWRERRPTSGVPPLKWSTNWGSFTPSIGGPGDGWEAREA